MSEQENPFLYSFCMPRATIRARDMSGQEKEFLYSFCMPRATIRARDMSGQQNPFLYSFCMPRPTIRAREAAPVRVKPAFRTNFVLQYTTVQSCTPSSKSLHGHEHTGANATPGQHSLREAPACLPLRRHSDFSCVLLSLRFPWRYK